METDLPCFLVGEFAQGHLSDIDAEALSYPLGQGRVGVPSENLYVRHALV